MEPFDIPSQSYCEQLDGGSKPALRVCFFIGNLGDGGAQRQCIALLNALQQFPEVELHLILLGSGEHDDSLDLSGLRLHRTDVANFANPRALAFAVRTLRRVRPDVLISWLHPADIWSYAATRIVRNVAWVITERASGPHPDEQLFFALRKQFGCRAAAMVIANSVAGKNLWDSFEPRSPVRMIPNMLIQQVVPSTPSADRTASGECLFVGRLDPQKNVGTMTAAFTRFAATHPQARLLLAGQGHLAGEVERIAAEAGYSQRVELLGFRRDVPALMARARLLLSFSEHEGMPNVLMEAVAIGVPAVVSDIPQHRALLGDDYPYYIQLSSPPEESAAVIAEAWENTISINEAYSHARAVLAKMTPQKVAASYLAAFREVAARRGPADDRTRGHRRRGPTRR